MCDIKNIGAIRPAIGILIPEFDFVEYWDAHEWERYFRCDIVEAGLGCSWMLMMCDNHLERIGEERRAVA